MVFFSNSNFFEFIATFYWDKEYLAKTGNWSFIYTPLICVFIDTFETIADPLNPLWAHSSVGDTKKFWLNHTTDEENIYKEEKKTDDREGVKKNCHVSLLIRRQIKNVTHSQFRRRTLQQWFYSFFSTIVREKQNFSHIFKLKFHSKIKFLNLLILHFSIL